MTSSVGAWGAGKLQERTEAGQERSFIEFEAGWGRQLSWESKAQRWRTCVSRGWWAACVTGEKPAWREVRRALPDCERPHLSHPKCHGKHANNVFHEGIHS